MATWLGEPAVHRGELDPIGLRPLVTLAIPDRPTVSLTDLGPRLADVVDLVLVGGQPRPELGPVRGEVEQCGSDGFRRGVRAQVELDVRHRWKTLGGAASWKVRGRARAASVGDNGRIRSPAAVSHTYIPRMKRRWAVIALALVLDGCGASTSIPSNIS